MVSVIVIICFLSEVFLSLRSLLVNWACRQSSEGWNTDLKADNRGKRYMIHEGELVPGICSNNQARAAVYFTLCVLGLCRTGPVAGASSRPLCAQSSGKPWVCLPLGCTAGACTPLIVARTWRQIPPGGCSVSVFPGDSFDGEIEVLRSLRAHFDLPACRAGKCSPARSALQE